MKKLIRPLAWLLLLVNLLIVIIEFAKGSTVEQLANNIVAIVALAVALLFWK